MNLVISIDVSLEASMRIAMKCHEKVLVRSLTFDWRQMNLQLTKKYSSEHTEPEERWNTIQYQQKNAHLSPAPTPNDIAYTQRTASTQLIDSTDEAD